jgi:glycosyltransferase involved in cell wall biosynthesis
MYKKIISQLYPTVGLLTVPTKLDSQGYSRRGIRNAYVPNPISFYPNELSDLSSSWVLCVGRLTDDKRHDLLLDIWHLSDIQRLGWKLRIIGKGECEPDLRRKIDALDLNESVFIEEPTSRIQEKYIASSIFLLTSRAEGFGLVLAEAMACGVPCICFDCPSGPRDIVDDGLTGRLLKEGDINGYVEALRELATNSILRLDLGQRARLSVKKFQTETVSEEFKRIFSKAFAPCTEVDRYNK